MKIAKKITAILADDIRREEGNKQSIMGIYGRDVILSKIPFLFPKLCVYLIVEELQKSVPFIKVELNIPKAETKKIELQPFTEDLIGKDVNIVLEMSPIKITEAGEATIQFFFGSVKKPSFIHKFSIREAKHQTT